MLRPVASQAASPGAPNTPSSSPTGCTCLVPAAVHDLVDGVWRQLGAVESVALGDLHNHLGVVVQVVGLLPQAEHFPHQDPCSARRATSRRKGKRADVRRYGVCQTGFTPRVRKATGQSEGSLGNRTGYGGCDCAITSGARGPFSWLPEPRALVLAGKRVNGKGGCSGSSLSWGLGLLQGGGWGLLVHPSPWQHPHSYHPAPTWRRDWSPRPFFLSALAVVCNNLTAQITFPWKFTDKTVDRIALFCLGGS